MTQVSLPTGVNNAGTNDWSDVYGNDSAITDVVNGGLDNANLSGTAGITAANLAAAVFESAGLNTTTTRRDFAEVTTSQSTTSTSFTDLATAGPAVTVNIPANGLVIVFAQVNINPSDFGGNNGAVSVSTIGGDTQVIRSTSTADTTYYTAPGALSGFDSIGTFNAGAAGFLMFPTPLSGDVAIGLKYKTTVAGQSAAFSERKLWVISVGGF